MFMDWCAHCRYEKRQAMKARFEIEQKLRRERRAKKKKTREVQEREQNRMVRTSRRSRQEDTSKSKAMDELKAKRSAGSLIFVVAILSSIVLFQVAIIRCIHVLLTLLPLYHCQLIPSYSVRLLTLLPLN